MIREFISGRRKIAKYKKLWKNQRNKAKRYRKLCSKLRKRLESYDK